MMALPPVALSDHCSPFDEAVLIIDGREEDTITIGCEGAMDIAHALILWINNQERVLSALTAADLVLGVVEDADKIRPELLESVRHLCRELKQLTGAAA